MDKQTFLRSIALLGLFSGSMYSVFPHQNVKRLEGTVIEVFSGDVIDIWSAGKEVNIHLYGIECPETGAPFHKKSYFFTTQKVLSKKVDVIEIGKGSNGVVSGLVYLDSNTTLNEELIRAGLARWNSKSAPEQHQMAGLQKKAQLTKRGIWDKGTPLDYGDYKKTQTLSVMQRTIDLN